MAEAEEAEACDTCNWLWVHLHLYYQISKGLSSFRGLPFDNKCHGISILFLN